ncbi:hypothetical protein ACAX43_21030 [Paraburkholderia sp. IW21]|uniref:hypothetical protein n=1 Tax=Paraburkholderia sp. IW21 TaxID=3242488 RepID=UPI003521CB9A
MVAIVAGNGLGLQSSSALGLGDRGQIGNASFGQTGEQIYVNAATGNLMIQDRDELLLGQGVNSQIYRAYNSQGKLMGDNWRPGGLRTVDGLTGTLNSVGSTVTRTDWDGTAMTYLYDASRKVYVATSGVGARSVLSFDATSSTWNWSDGSHRIFEAYDANHGGRLTTTRDSDGNAISYTYNADNLLSQVRTANGDITWLDYNGARQLSALRTVYQNASGQQTTATTVRYGYNSQGRLGEVVIDLTPDDNSVADGKLFRTTYTYDGTSSRIASIAQSDGSSVAFTYQLVGSDYRVASIVQTSGAGAARRTTLAYQPTTNTTTITDPLGQVTVLRYDSSNRLTSIVTPATGGTSRAQTFIYDTGGNLAQIDDAGIVTQYRYDSQGNLVWQKDGNGNTIERTFGADNQLLTETAAIGQSDSASTRYAYDARNHVRFTVSAEGRVTEYRYNALGQRVSVLTYASGLYTGANVNETDLSGWVAAFVSGGQGTRVDTSYDFRGNVASVTQYGRLLADGTGDANAGAGEIVQVRYVYDPSGRLLQRIAGDAGHPQVEQFTYDGLGRVLCATKLDGTITLYQYDDAGHQVIATFGNGLTRTSTYDAAGELISVAESSGGKVLSQIRNQYDADGRLRMSTDATGQITHYLYDEAGRAVARIDPAGALTEYVYTSNGLLTNTIQYATPVAAAALAALMDGSGRPVEMVNVAGKSVALTLANGNLRPTISKADRKDWRAYDNAGNVTGVVNADGSFVRYQHDGAGRLVTRTECASAVDITRANPAEGNGPAYSANDRTTRYFYDHDGLLRGQLDAEGYLTTYRYNAAGQKVETVGYATATPASARATGILTDLVPAGDSKDIHQYFLYDSRGLLRSEIDGEGYLTTYQYDAYGNVSQRIRGQQINPAWLGAPQQVPLTFQAKASSANTTLEVWIDGVRAGSIVAGSANYATYTLNVSNVVPLANHMVEFRSPAGSQVAVRDASFGTRPFAAASDSARTAPVAGNPAQIGVSYRLDAATTANCWATLPGQLEQTSYVYDAMGRLLERTAYSGSGSATTRFTYDSQGHVATETTGDRVVSYRYDAQGRLIGQLMGEGSAALSALGKGPTQTQIDAVWKSWGVAYAYDAAGRRISMSDANGNRTLYCYDGAGRLTHVVNPLGEVVESRYDMCGEITQTVVYGSRIASSTLGTLAGGLLTDALKNTFSALDNDGLATRTSFSYSAAGALTQRTDASGYKTDYAYNTFGEQIAIARDISAGVRVQDVTDYDRLGQAVRKASDAVGLNLVTRAVYDAFGRATESVDANGVLRRQDYDRNGHLVVLTDGTGARSNMTYDAFGNVLSRTDANGNRTSYAYSAFSREIAVTTAEGIKTTSSYNEFGQLVTLLDGRGNLTRYAYDLDGNLLTATDATGASITHSYDHADRLIDTTDARGIHTAYAYDAAGRTLTRTVDPSGLKLVTRYEYDAKGQTVKVTDPSGVVTETQYDLNGRHVSVITDRSGLNLRTTFIYDGMGNVLTTTEGAGTDAAKVTQNTYDKAGRLVSVTVEPAGLRLTTTYTYDGDGNVASVTDAAGGVTRYAYDKEGRQTWSVGPTGAVIGNVYDAAGYLLSRTVYSRYNRDIPDGDLSDDFLRRRVVASRLDDHATRYVHDRDGRVRYVVDAAYQVTEQIYDANGNVVRSIAYANWISWNGTSTVDAVQSALALQDASAHSADRTTQMVYDAANRLTAVIDALGFVTRNRYDASGNLLERTQYQSPYSAAENPDDATLQGWVTSQGAQNTGQNHTTSWTYDTANRIVYAMDAEGYVTENRYDAAGRLLKTIRYVNAYEALRGATDKQMAALLPSSLPSNPATSYGYDVAGRLITTTDPMGAVTRYKLDALGRAVVTTAACGTEQQGVTSTMFDAAGRIIEQTLARGATSAATTRYAYDGMGRLIQEIDARGVELIEQDTDWALAARKARGFVDADGNGLKAAALGTLQKANLLAAYTTTYTYSTRGELLTTTDPLGYTTTNAYDLFGNVTQTTDKNGYTTQLGYDALNRVIRVTAPQRSVVQTQYDAFGGVVSVTQDSSLVTKMEYDRLGRLTKSTDAMKFAEQYAYDAFGNRISYINKVGGQFSYQYDRRGLMVTETLPVTSGGRAVVNRFEYDSRRNRITTIEAAGLPEQRLTSYEYDALDRQVRMVGALLNTTSADGTTKYVNLTETRAYDARGNLTRIIDANGLATSYYYDEANRRTAQVGPDGAYTTWSYDAAGNVLEERRHATPVSATAGSTPPALPAAANLRLTRYAYDANNRRIESRIVDVAAGALNPSSNVYDITTGDLVSTWEYDGNGNVVVSIDPNGNRTTTFWSSQGKVLEIDPMGYGTTWYRDAQGNVEMEYRYAIACREPFTARSDPNSLLAPWPFGADDRRTDFTWDRNGRMTSEARQDVAYATVDANGNLTERTGEAKTTYTYDGEGHLLRRVDANGSQYDFTYDKLGRQTGATLPSFTDYLNRSVRSSTVYEYDGLNHVVKETAQGDVNRVTTYTYGAGGRLMSKTNALGVVTQFGYDAAGNTTMVKYLRADADRRSQYETTWIAYDAAGHEVSRVMQTSDPVSGAISTTGERHEMQYNMFGEVTGRRTGGGNANGAWQEYAEYNNAGKVIRTNFGDGVSHVFMYDRNGNATLKIESMTADLRSYEIRDILNDSNLSQTFTRYDARNQVGEILQPKVVGGAPRINFTPVDIRIDGGKFATTQLTISGWIEAANSPGSATASIDARSTHDTQVATQLRFGLANQITLDGLDVDLPDLSTIYGSSYSVRVVFTLYSQFENGSDSEPTSSKNPISSSWSWPVTFTGGASGPKHIEFSDQKTGMNVLPYGPSQIWYAGRPVDQSLNYRVQIYVNDEDTELAQAVGTVRRSEVLSGMQQGKAQFGQVTTSLKQGYDTLRFTNTTWSAGVKTAVYISPAKSPGVFSLAKRLGSPDASVVDLTNLADGAYDVLFMATSGTGALLAYSQYGMQVSHGTGEATSIVEVPANRPAGASVLPLNDMGACVWDSDGNLNIFAARGVDGRLAGDMLVRYRPSGSSGPWSLSNT